MASGFSLEAIVLGMARFTLPGQPDSGPNLIKCGDTDGPPLPTWQRAARSGPCAV